ncbi:redoxin domain-containing protein [Staphylococcus saccharolyticus]|uniref:Glutathione peroxidase n=2 Tax=Staphylococcus saccharolyticus TaxID=33028 RepID=A0A380H098_9STAP|nr:redoxin domain-containing protein [Staphylococcus saccharolyticus]MBL7571089.1 redoxin domain-containing protein [Staphylococcus saccharolyticus]QQB98937.1 redoxin domain-containing protein [Staphylococcus saccharolyticus]QRJ66849.1 redoxin domain-containing protein [Staphylococcus saccharolyticus]SUM67989.1 glutathione peroxidase [Staphylococcus saccharolyticus]
MNMSVYDIEVENYNGSTYFLEKYKGKVLIIVNTATNCALNDQLKKLETIYRKYNKDGLEILCFPYNDFDNQEPGLMKNIYRKYRHDFGITFPIHYKISVNGDNEHLLYTLLKFKQPGLFGSQIKWNFTKFVIDREGNVVKRYLPFDKLEQIEIYIRQLL